MDFLGLVQALAREADVSGGAPTSVVNQTGETGRLVHWIQSSYLDLTSMHPQWRFMRREFSFPVSASDRDYTFAEIQTLGSLTFGIRQLDTETLRCYRTSSGLTTENHLHFYPWPNFRDVFLMGQGNVATGTPGSFSVDRGDKLVLDVLPDDAYTIRGECIMTPAYLAASNTSVPIIPEWAHMAIVWGALLHYAGFEEDAPQFVRAKNWYGSLLARLEDTELPEMEGPAPLVY